ncbi:MAG: DUF302 domain-containing protein [Anaerolineae bacterium]|nr:DUF302 domain-containing protein [Anaerolineae bacterium]
MTDTIQSLGFQVRVKTDFETAQQWVADALKTEGFGVLTEIDVKSTIKQKLGEDFRPYKILGACNPKLAHRALTAAPMVGLLLPCNVTVEQADAETVLVSLVDPMMMLDVVQDSELESIAEEAHARLSRVAAILEEKA